MHIFIFIISINNCVLNCFVVVVGLIKRCYQCRSRGELGNCKDPFQYNATQVETVHGVTAIPCASGWCGKVIEGESSAFREDGKIDSCDTKILQRVQ